MNKVLVYGGVAAIAYLGYKVFVQPQMGLVSVSPFSKPNGDYINAALMGQPNQKYPFQAVQAPRVDNSNQPWYGGNRLAAQGPVAASPMPTQLQNDAMQLKAGANIIESLTSIWDNLGVGEWFTSDDNEVKSENFSSLDSFNWSF